MSSRAIFRYSSNGPDFFVIFLYSSDVIIQIEPRHGNTYFGIGDQQTCCMIFDCGSISQYLLVAAYIVAQYV